MNMFCFPWAMKPALAPDSEWKGRGNLENLRANLFAVAAHYDANFSQVSPTYNVPILNFYDWMNLRPQDASQDFSFILFSWLQQLCGRWNSQNQAEHHLLLAKITGSVNNNSARIMLDYNNIIIDNTMIVSHQIFKNVVREMKPVRV